MENPLWLDEPFTRAQAWVDLIMLANHKDGFIRVRGIRVVVKRGFVGWSEVALSARWKWSRGKTRRFIRELESVQQIEQQKNNVSSLFAIVNYEQYQSGGTADDTADGQQTVQQTDTNNNVKKKNKIKRQVENGPENQQPDQPPKPDAEPPLLETEQAAPKLYGGIANRKQLQDLWNKVATANELPKVRKIPDNLWTGWKCRAAGEPDLWALVETECERLADFVLERPWLTLHWIAKSDTNCSKLLEGNYRRRDVPTGFRPAQPAGMPDDVYEGFCAKANGDLAQFQNLTTLWRMNR